MTQRAVSLTVLAFFLLPVALPAQEQQSDAPPVVDVTAVDYAFQAPDSIPSGWVTFRMTNRGRDTHYFLLERLPEGRTFEDYREEILPAYDSIQQALAAGPADSAQAVARVAAAVLPDWGGIPLPHAGGVGLTAPGKTGQTTVRLDPGRYVLSCFLTTPDGDFHGLRGMIRPVTVAQSSSGVSPPGPDVEITSSGRQVTVEGSFKSGEQMVAIHVKDPPDDWTPPYEFSLARLGPDVEVNDVATWNERLYRNPAPATFLGGVEAVPAGETAYVIVELEPGRYGWFGYHQEEPLIERFTVK